MTVKIIVLTFDLIIVDMTLNIIVLTFDRYGCEHFSIDYQPNMTVNI